MDTVATLPGDELAAVGAIWVSQQREMVVAFGGTSMSPTIKPGQKVVLRWGVMPEREQIAVYRLGEQLAVHRVVARDDRGGWFLTWGDANALPDLPVDDRARVLGTIIAAEREGEMGSIPAAPRSVFQRALLRFVAPPGAASATVARRVSLLFRIRANVALGPVGIIRKIAAKLTNNRA